ncbi:uncharacterized protein BO88DRAFT_84315 [Aspergillus vadensis CBS 113365]|uniref:Uncharacterized protein n=1 Tax=Aspergillus vadensis (strain CBS 113365 / IMI 142717 / IBT 24658) TaxID=1448311 RepID=A0A319BN48_ASPVC|nr:hypothetical protein BO88DRAFT_84315 [Aspergillus vadensis CBS 113365]PYH67143.1 hypothetical protein BO88DRAFT_84315 [Aspergillus vadensis CBS 113365]
MLPCDEEEQDRLDLFHKLFTGRCGRGDFRNKLTALWANSSSPVDATCNNRKPPEDANKSHSGPCSRYPELCRPRRVEVRIN